MAFDRTKEEQDELAWRSTEYTVIDAAGERFRFKGSDQLSCDEVVAQASKQHRHPMVDVISDGVTYAKGYAPDVPEQSQSTPMVKRGRPAKNEIRVSADNKVEARKIYRRLYMRKYMKKKRAALT